MTSRGVKAVPFATPAGFRSWLVKNHAKSPELLVRFYKRGSGYPSMTWPESVDQALCFGWIDGVRRRVDDVSYSIRFTPRRPGSNWSTVNIKRVAELQKRGQMKPAGLKAFSLRSEAKSEIYSYEKRYEVSLEPDHEERLKANAAAWAYFQKLAPSYRYLSVFHVVSAKQDATRLRRLDRLIAAWTEGRRGW